MLVVDEAYVDFADGDAMALVGRLPNVVVLRTLSKSFSLAGLRAGLAFGHPELLAGVRTVRDSYNVNRLTQLAAEAALADLPHMRANVARIRATRAPPHGRTRAARLRGPRIVGQLRPRPPPRHRPGADRRRPRRPRRPRPPLPHAKAPRRLRITVGTDDEIDVLLGHLRDLTRS